MSELALDYSWRPFASFVTCLLFSGFAYFKFETQFEPEAEIHTCVFSRSIKHALEAESPSINHLS